MAGRNNLANGEADKISRPDSIVMLRHLFRDDLCMADWINYPLKDNLIRAPWKGLHVRLAIDPLD